MDNKDLVHELNFSTGGLFLRVSTISDIQVELGRLQIEMDNAKPEIARLYLDEWHRKVRMLSDLITYAASDLKADYKKISDLKQNLFDNIIKDSDE